MAPCSMHSGHFCNIYMDLTQIFLDVFFFLPNMTLNDKKLITRHLPFSFSVAIYLYSLQSDWILKQVALVNSDQALACPRRLLTLHVQT